MNERDTISRAWRHGSTDITVVRAHSIWGAFSHKSYKVVLQKNDARHARLPAIDYETVENAAPVTVN